MTLAIIAQPQAGISGGFYNLYQLCVNEFGPVLECCIYRQRIRDITAKSSSD